MAAMALRLTLCLLVLGLAHGDSDESDESQARRSRLSFPILGRQVLFQAYLASDTVFQVHDTIVYSDVQQNDGDGYNPSTGVFTAPVTGVYLFIIHLQRVDGVKTELGLWNNGRLVASTDSAQSWVSNSFSSIQEVQKGDPVHVTNDWGSGDGSITLRGGFHNQFTGYLIHRKFGI